MTQDAVMAEAGCGMVEEKINMDVAEIYEAMFEKNVRFENMWLFPCLPATNEQIEALSEALEDGRLPPELASLFEPLDEDDRDTLSEGRWEARDLYDEICGSAFRSGLFGLIGEAATPVFSPSGATSATFSWGHYKTKLLFAPTSEALIQAALNWAEEEYAEDMKPRAS